MDSFVNSSSQKCFLFVNSFLLASWKWWVNQLSRVSAWSFLFVPASLDMFSSKTIKDICLQKAQGKVKYWESTKRRNMTLHRTKSHDQFARSVKIIATHIPDLQ